MSGSAATFPLLAVGGLSTAVFMCGALAQLAVGRLVERYPMHLLFAAVALMQFGGLVWVAVAKGPILLVALAVTMAAIYGAGDAQRSGDRPLYG